MMVSAVQSCGVMPSSMPFWLRNGPAWTHSASTRIKKKETVIIFRCGLSIRRRLTPVSFMRWVNVPSDACQRGSPCWSGSSARSFSTP